MKINYKKWGIILGIIVVLIISANIILSSIISNIVTNQLEKINKKGEVTFKVDRVFIDIFTSKLKIRGISIKPDSLYFQKFKAGETEKSAEATFELSKLNIKGVNLFKILLFKEINLKRIEAKGIDVTVYKSDKFIKNEVEEEKKEDVRLDSIFIKGIKDIGLSEIWIDELEFKIINVQSNDTLFAYTENECSITGVDLKPYEDSEGLFALVSNNFNINLKKQHFDLKTGNYSILFEEINFNYEDQEIKINDFSLKPTEDKFELARSFPYNSEVFDVDVEDITISGVDFDRVVLTGVTSIDTILVNGLNINIFKDQTKPFNLEKRPKFVNEKLKTLKDAINIETFLVKDSHLLYQERLPETKNLMAIAISDLNAQISNITSIKDSLKAKEKLTINLKGKLNDKASLNLDIFMPYTMYNNSFSFEGQVGKAKFSDFNSAIYPALGAKVKSGTIDHISFSVNGTPTGTTGSMTLLYHDLSADFFKAKPKNEGEKSKAMSWLANSVVTGQNPTAKGRTLVALIEFERVPYKGFGNIIWKSFMSGLVNTVSPLGKIEKESKDSRETRKEDNKETKKEERQAKRNKKKEKG